EEGRQHREISMERRLYAPEPGNPKEDIDLRQRHDHARQELRNQQEPAWEGADQQRAHVAHLAVVDHRERGLHAAEEKDHAGKPGRDINFVKNVGLVGWNDRDPQDLPEAGGEDEQPHQGAHKRGNKALALVQESQRLASEYAAHANEITRKAERTRDGRGRDFPGALNRHCKASIVSGAMRQRRSKASSTVFEPVCASTSRRRPVAVTSPWRSITV